MQDTTESSTIPSVKIAYIGGGSRYWARDLMKDLALKAPFGGAIALYDIDTAAAQRNVEIAKQIFARPEAVQRFAVEAVERMEDCLKGADFVVISIEPGPIEMRYTDLEIPAQYGITQPVGDTTGPGGLLRSMRAIPMFLEFGEAIMQHCPNAWVINYTNPMTLCMAALFAVSPNMKAFGCCHEVFGSQNRLKKLCEKHFAEEAVHRDEVKVDVTGVNHFTWITAAQCRGHNLMPPLFAEAADPANFADASAYAAEQVAEAKYFGGKGMVALDLARQFGALAAAGDRHLVEFVPWYARSEALLHRWGVVLTPYSYRVQRTRQPDKDAASYGQTALNPTGEEGVRQMAALLGLEDFDTNVNVLNRGQAPDLPLGVVVETNAAFRRDALTPLLARPLPTAAHALVQRVIAVQSLTLEACRTRDLDLAFQALLCDPLTVVDPDKARAMFTAMRAHIAPELTALGW